MRLNDQDDFPMVREWYWTIKHAQVAEERAKNYKNNPLATDADRAAAQERLHQARGTERAMGRKVMDLMLRRTTYYARLIGMEDGTLARRLLQQRREQPGGGVKQ